MPDHTDIAERFQGYEVVDAQGQRLGSIQSLWLDTATREPEFVAVRTGRQMGRTHIVPVAGAQVDEGSRGLRVPYSHAQIESAPHIDEHAELSEQEEEQVYRHYGVRRSEAPSPTGLAGGGTRGQGEQQRTEGTTSAAWGRRSDRIHLREERLQVATEREQAGEVELGKRVVEHTETAEVPVREERVVIERRPGSGEAVAGEITAEGETVEVDVMRERPVVEKETVVTEEVDVRKEAVVRTEQVQETLRKEDLVVEEQGDVSVSSGATTARETDGSGGRRS